MEHLVITSLVAIKRSSNFELSYPTGARFGTICYYRLTSVDSHAIIWTLWPRITIRLCFKLLWFSMRVCFDQHVLNSSRSSQVSSRFRDKSIWKQYRIYTLSLSFGVIPYLVHIQDYRNCLLLAFPAATNVGLWLWLGSGWANNLELKWKYSQIPMVLPHESMRRGPAWILSLSTCCITAIWPEEDSIQDYSLSCKFPRLHRRAVTGSHQRTLCKAEK